MYWQPAYHWTDQKLRVHGFSCVLALLDELSAVRAVAVIYPPGTPGARKDHTTLRSMYPRQRKLAGCFDIAGILAGA